MRLQKVYRKQTNHRYLLNSLIQNVKPLLMSTAIAVGIISCTRITTYASVRGAVGSTVVVDGSISISSDVYGEGDTKFATATSTPEKIENLADASFSNSSIPFSQYGFYGYEYDRFSMSSHKKKTKIKWDKDSKEYIVYLVAGNVYDAPSFRNVGICSGSTMYGAADDSYSDSDGYTKDNDMNSPDVEYAAKLTGINLNANTKETLMANNAFSHPGTSYSSEVIDYNITSDTSVFPTSYPDLPYALPEDLAQLCPWYMSYKKIREYKRYKFVNGTRVEYVWKTTTSWEDMDSKTAWSIFERYQNTKYVKKDEVNAIWKDLSGEEDFEFMKSNITGRSRTYSNGREYHTTTLGSYNRYNWVRVGELYDNYDTNIPVDADVYKEKYKDPKYTEYWGEIKYENHLSSDWQVSADEKTWYTILTGSTEESVSFNMLTHAFKIGYRTCEMPEELKDEDTWYVRRISTAAGIYGTTVSPSMKIRPFITLDGIDLWSKVDVVEGNYLSPNDIVLNVHYSTGDRLMAGNGSYISYPGNANLRITMVGDNWVYYVFKDPVTKGILKGFFKVKGIQKSPISATAEYVGGTVIEQNNYKPEYLHVNVTFNNGTIDTFTADSASVGTYKYKSYGRGDMDGNGVLNSMDASLLESVIKGSTATATQKKQADVNGDDKINDADLTKLNEYISKKVTKIGKNEFYAAYSGLHLSDGTPKYARFTVEGVKKKPYKLTIVSEPVKMRYIEGDDFKPSGMTLKVLYDNGEYKYISYGDNDFNIAGVQLGDDDIPAIGMKADTVMLPIYYTENNETVKTELKLTVILSTLTSIKVTRAPDTLVYYAGESFKSTGMNVTAYFDEGVDDHTPDEQLLTASDYILTNYKSLKDSTEYIILKLDDPSKVQKAMGEYIRIPKVQLQDQDFTDGKAGTFTYKNGNTVSGTICGNHLVRISYTYRGVTKETYQPIYAMAKKPTALTIVSMPYKVDYTAGEDFIQDGLILRVAYSDGSSNYLYAKTESRNGYTIATGTDLKIGQNYVIAEYTENNTTLQLEIPIMVIDPSIDGITATYLGPSIYVSQNFNRKDVQIVVSYTNGDIKAFRANEPNQTVRFVKPNADTGEVNLSGTETLTVTENGDNTFAAVYAGLYDTFIVPGVGKSDQLDFTGSVAKSKRMYDTWTEKFTAIKLKSVSDYINGRVEDSLVEHEVNAQKTTDTRQYLTSEEGTGQGVVLGTGTANALLSFLREGTWRQPETVISLQYKGRTKGYLYPETTNPQFAMTKESDLKYITAHEQIYTTSRDELQGYMEEGWSDWTTNGDSIGTVSSDRIAYRYTGTGENTDSETMVLHGIKIKLDNITGSSAPRLNISVKTAAGVQTNYNGITENDTIMDPAQIKINLAGTVQVIDNYGNEVTKNFGDVYKIYYRASTDDSVKWSQGGGKTLEDGTIKDGEWAGFDGVHMQCLEIRLMLADADFDIGSMSEAPVINSQPKNISTKIGNNATLAISAVGNDLVYQWYLNGVAVPDATTAVYATPQLTLDNNGDVYYCIVTSNNGNGISSKSDSVTITVRDQAPVMIQDLEERIACSIGDEISLSVNATSLNPVDLKYEWQITKNGSYVPLAGGVDNAIRFTVTPDMHGQYIRCHVTNSTGACNSNPCLIQCIEAPVVTVKSSEISNYVNVSKTKVLTFTADVISYAAGDRTYTWVIDGITKGTTTDSITWIPNTEGTHSISCTVKDSLGKTGTGNYNVYVGQKPIVKLTATKVKETNGTWTVYVQATVTSSDSANLTYKWGIDGSEITTNTSTVSVSADHKTLTLRGLTTGSQRSVSLEITDHYGSSSTLAGTVAQ